MAIKVITKGVPPKDKVFKGTCHNCKSVVECKKEDGNHSYGDQRDPGEMVNIMCPVCHSNMYCYG